MKALDSISSWWRTALLAGAVGLCAMPTELAGQTASAKEIARRSLPAVVTIVTSNADGSAAQGSGFVVHPNGLIVTNFHVIDNAVRASVFLQNSDEYRVEGVLEADDERDFAILKIRAIDLPVLRMGNSDRLEPGEVVLALGAPKGLSGSVTTGNFSQLRPAGGYGMIQHSAAISPGSSGGPLLLETGEVVGINTAGRTDLNSVFLALPINYVRAAIANSDGRLMALADLTKAVGEARARLQQQKRAAAIQEHFVVYQDPENLFAAMVPRAWQVQRNAWADREGTYHVIVMAHAPAAQLAEPNGWLSDGLRLHLMFPRKGMSWRVDGAAQWIAAGRQQTAGSYAQYEVIAQDEVKLDGLATSRLVMVGTAPRLREPEAIVLYHVFHTKGMAVIELASPRSRSEELEWVRAAFETTFTIGWKG